MRMQEPCRAEQRNQPVRFFCVHIEANNVLHILFHFCQPLQRDKTISVALFLFP